MAIKESHIIPKLVETSRLIDYLIGIFESVNSKKGLKKAIKKGLIKVNGELAQTTQLVYGGEEVTLEEKEEAKMVLELPLVVLYEDEHLAVVNKPAGIEVSNNKFRTLVNALPFNLQKSPQHDALAQPHSAHRLDYPTSGALLVGKTQSALFALSKLFEQKKIVKIYYAVTIGDMQKQGKIELPIDGKDCLTDYEVIEQLPSPKYGSLNLVKLSPKTGRKHQLRIHLSRIGHPILGDKDYGKEGLILKGKGLYLHAYSLFFDHPVTGKSIRVHQELPKKFLSLFPEFMG